MRGSPASCRAARNMTSSVVITDGATNCASTSRSVNALMRSHNASRKPSWHRLRIRIGLGPRVDAVVHCSTPPEVLPAAVSSAGAPKRLEPSRGWPLASVRNGVGMTICALEHTQQMPPQEREHFLERRPARGVDAGHSQTRTWS